MVTESNKRIKTKRIIQEAMVDLLHRESFDEISTVQLAKEAGISAVIAADVAVMAYCNQIGQEVHLSTQLNIRNAEALKFY